MQQVNHSELRHRILSSLKLAPAESVTALAQMLDVLRPSVSRAVKSLEDAGLVTRSGRRITLSQSGQAELLRYDDTLATKVLRDAEAATRVFGHTFDKMNELNALAMQFGVAARKAATGIDSSALRAIEGISNLSTSLQKFATFNETLTAVSEAMKNNAVVQASEALKISAVTQAAEAFNATAIVQAANLDLLKVWAVEPLSSVSSLISANNLALGTILSDIDAFAKVGMVADKALGGLVSQTLLTTKVYDSYFVDAVKSLGVMPILDDLRVSVSLPTQSMASLVGTTRSIVEAGIGMPTAAEAIPLIQIRPPIYSRQYQVAKSRIEIYLEPLGRRFVNKWEGAWQTFRSDSKDRHSQAAHSGRELLMQVLAYLAPDNVFTAKDLARRKVPKPTRTMRIEYILKDRHGKTVELITNYAKTLDSMYDVLVGEAHRRDEKELPDDTLAGMLAILENLLIMLLSMRKSVG